MYFSLRCLTRTSARPPPASSASRHMAVAFSSKSKHSASSTNARHPNPLADFTTSAPPPVLSHPSPHREPANATADADSLADRSMAEFFETTPLDRRRTPQEQLQWSLWNILAPGNRSHKSSRRRAIDVSPQELLSHPGVFRGHEPVKYDIARHWTTLESMENIQSSSILNATHSESDYDGPLHGEATPKSVYCTLDPASEPQFPFSFRSQVEPGSALGILSLDVRHVLGMDIQTSDTSTSTLKTQFNSISSHDKVLDASTPLPSSTSPLSASIRPVQTGDFELYLCALIPTQFGPTWGAKVHAHVAAVPVEHREFAEKNFVPLTGSAWDPLFFGSDGVCHIATKINARMRDPLSTAARKSDGLLKDGEAAPFPLVVSLVILRDIQLDPATHHWSKGYRLHKTKGLIRCPVGECSFSTSRLSEVKNHFSRSHMGANTPLELNNDTDTRANKDSMYKCQIDECGDEFTLLQSMWRHQRVKHRNVRYQCPKCDKRFTDVDSRKRHVESIHEGVVYKCPVCTKDFSQRTNMLRHLRTAHGDRVLHECPLRCGRSFSTKQNANRHMVSTCELYKDALQRTQWPESFKEQAVDSGF